MGLVLQTQTETMLDTSADQRVPTLSLQTAAIFAGTVPILIVYPFVQRYFMKGIMLGALKGE
jgi:putative aldouronate transport system permease protein